MQPWSRNELQNDGKYRAPNRTHAPGDVPIKMSSRRQIAARSVCSLSACVRIKSSGQPGYKIMQYVTVTVYRIFIYR